MLSTDHVMRRKLWAFDHQLFVEFEFTFWPPSYQGANDGSVEFDTFHVVDVYDYRGNKLADSDWQGVQDFMNEVIRDRTENDPDWEQVAKDHATEERATT